MSYTTESVVKTRKPHRCVGCWRKYEVGSILASVTHLNNDGASTSYWCQDCYDATSHPSWQDFDFLGGGEVGYWTEDGKWKLQYE